VIPYIEVVAGFALLLLGGELLVRGAVAAARRLGISPLFVGLTIVAFGTSAPEMFVCLIAALKGAPAISVGNVVGSNIANILLILGVAAVIFPISRHRRSLYRDGTVMLVATGLFVLLARAGTLGLWHGAVMLLGLLLYLAYSYQTDRRDQQAASEIVKEVEELRQAGQPQWLAWVKLAGGLAGVVVGSKILVDGGVVIARQFDIPEAVIGLTMFAVGTSLPELATSAIAAYRKHSDLALGNVVGSNIFNLLSVMGVVAVVTPVAVPEQIIRFDLWVMLGVSVVFLALAFALRRLGRVIGGLFLLAYAAYVVALFAGVSGVPPAAG